MAGHQRVHPRAEADSPSRDSFASSSSAAATTSYVIQIPKDQIYRIPPPENEYKFRLYTRQSKRRSSHCRRRRCCCCWTFSTLALLASVAFGVFYLIIRPQTPNYSVNSLSFSGFNNLTSSATISPRIHLRLTARNPNKKISIDYRPGGYAAAYHNGLRLCDGALPVFHQPRQNVTVIETALGGGGSGTSSGLVLGSQSKEELARELSAGMVPLRLNLRSPVRLKFGDVMTWTVTVKVRCDLAVDKLAADTTILSNNCEFGVKLW